VEVLVGEDILGRGVGRSKKDAQQHAAKQAYETLTANTVDDDSDASEAD